MPSAPMMVGFDELMQASGLTGTTRPIDDDTVLAAVNECYGFSGDLRRIATEKDDTFELRTQRAQRHLVKISGPAEPPGVVNLQTEALLHVARHAPHLPVPALESGVDGRYEYAIGDRVPRILRIMTFLDGCPLASQHPTPAQLALVGNAHAQLSAALADFTHREQHRVLAWDLRYVPVLREQLSQVDSSARSAIAASVIDAFDAAIGNANSVLNTHVVHGDLSPYNVLVDPSLSRYVTGVIDFGDVNYTAEVFDVAIAMSNLINPNAEDPWGAALALFAGYARLRPLAGADVLLLPVAVAARSVQRALIAQWRATHDSSRAEYVLSHALNDWAVVERLSPATWQSVIDRINALNSLDGTGVS